MNLQVRTDYVASSEPRYQLCSVQPPPAGRKVILLTVGGVAILGPYNQKQDAGFIIAWAPMPTIPPDVRAELYAASAPSSQRKDAPDHES